MIAQSFWSPGGWTAAQRFELAKRSEPELIAFLRRFPKGADLHSHLGGAIYSDFLSDTARATGKRFDVGELNFTNDSGEATISLDDFERNQTLFNNWGNSLSMRGQSAGTLNGHDHFFATFARIGAAERSDEAMLAEILTRNRYQNVPYLELMAAPLAPSAIDAFVRAGVRFDPADLPASLAGWRKYIDDPVIAQAIRAEVDSYEAAVGELLGQPLSQYPVKVRYVLSLDRTGGLDRFFGAAVLFITAMRADSRFVAINMVAPEDLPVARRQFDAQMGILDLLWHTLGPFKLTLHAGELALRDSPVEAMQERIRRTLDQGHASRIGHGTSVAWERDLPGLLEQMRAQGVLVEVALSSAEEILNVSGARHPLAMYRSAGVPVCLCTDDEGVSRSNLTMEYVKATQRHALDYEALKELSRNCIEYSFARGESLYLGRDYAHVRADMGAVRQRDWQPDAAQRALLAANERMALQVQLERAFLDFEQSLDTGFRESQSPP